MPGFELIGEEERKAVNDLFDDGGVLFAHGFDNMRNDRYHVREFESQFAEYLGVKYAQAVSSGTAALKIAMLALGVKPGDEVITQAFTFIATAEAIIDIGAKPVFININKTLNMDPDELESAITNKTAAIIPVHMLGVAVDQDKIHTIAKNYKIPVLDDACESLGAEWSNEKLGSQCDIAAWSFDAGKTIIAGEGGMITTNDKELYLLAREYHDHGHMNNENFPRGRDTHRISGFNYRMTEIQAVIAKVQLEKLDYIVEKNRENYSIVESALLEINGLKLRKVPNKCKPLCDTLIIQFDSRDMAADLVVRLQNEGLGTKNVPDAIEWHFAKYWDHMFDFFEIDKTEFEKSLDVSTEIIERCVALPIFVSTSRKEVSGMAKKIKILVNEVLKNNE
jgi:8-amino-3,8-dideoxy-alpha-D-manno-octulosonate transaminase